ncbi:MAG: hypothetical protein ACXABY_20700, partial [Candidatus Thorarchaeota archaeon]
HNLGRRPVNLVEAGLRYTNGMGSVYDDLSHFFPQLLYKNDGRNLCFQIAEVAKELKSHNTEIMYGYFTDEAGREYKKKASSALKDYINELITSRETKTRKGTDLRSVPFYLPGSVGWIRRGRRRED